MQNQHTHTPDGQASSRAVAHNSTSGGISLPAPVLQMKHAVNTDATVIQRVIAGLEAYTEPAAIPEEWVNAFINDIADHKCHLYEAEIYDLLMEEVPDWMDTAKLKNVNGDHWDVTFLKKGITISTKADGSCGIHAIHAIIHQDSITAPVDNYIADSGYIDAKRAIIQQKAQGDKEDIKKRIAEEIKKCTVVAECGFGPQLTATLEGLQASQPSATDQITMPEKIVPEHFITMDTEGPERSRPPKRSLPSRGVIQWESEKTGKLRWFIDGWYVMGGSHYYKVLNEDTSNYGERDVVSYKKPFAGYKAGDGLDLLKGSCQVVSITGKDTPQQAIASDTEQQIIDIQTAASEAQQAKRQKVGATQEKYAAKHLKGVKYAVAWNSQKLTVSGSTESRNMHTSMDMEYRRDGQTHAIPGEATHERLRASNGTNHGNIVAGYYRLAYLDGDKLELSKGSYFYYGSGKAQENATDKHRNADEIATMLVDSGQLASADEYDDGKHSHSEQALIVGLSKDLTVFDRELRGLNKMAQSKKLIVTSLLIDLYSAPNTVCKRCHDSLEIFLAKTDWKDKVTAHLAKQAVTTILIDSPDIILRASANVPFGGTSNAIAKAKKEQKGFTANKGDADLFFVERTPFDKHY